MKAIFFYISLIIPIFCYSQTRTESIQVAEQKFIDLLKKENSDSIGQYRIKNNIYPSKREVEEAFINLLSTPESFTYSFEALQDYEKYDLRIFDLKDSNLRIFQLDGIFKRYAGLDFNFTSLIQYKTKNGEVKVYPLSNYKGLFIKGLFYNNISFDIEEVDKVRSGKDNLYLVKAYQGFSSGGKNGKKIIYFFIKLTDKYIILDSPIYEGDPFLAITTYKEEYEIKTTIKDSVPTIDLMYRVDECYEQNKFKKERDDASFVKVKLKYNGRIFKIAENEKPKIKADNTMEWYNLPYISLKQLITDQLKYIDSYNYFDSTYTDINIDSVSNVCSLMLTRLLTHKESLKLNSEEIGLSLSVKTSDKHQIRVFGFYYDSGGSRGGISNHVIQWIDKDGKLYSELLPNGYGFYEIHSLKSTMPSDFYVLLGVEKGNSSTMLYTFYVIQFIGNRLITTYPAFVNRPVLTTTNSEISFDSKTQSISISPFDSGIDLVYIIHGPYSEKKEANEKIKKKLSCDFCETIKIQFNGRKFID